MRLVFALIAVLLTASTAAAETVCGPWQETLVLLYEKTGQLPEVIAVGQTGVVVIIAVNPKTKEYTTMVQPNENTICLVAGGIAWDKAPQSVIDMITSKVGDPT